MRTLPLLSTASHLLPGGVTTHTLPESLYLDILRHCQAQPPKLLVAMVDEQTSDTQNNQIAPIVTLSDIVDFNVNKAGQITISIRGTECVYLKEIELSPEKLKLGYFEPLSRWPSKSLPEEYQYLRVKLEKYLSSNPSSLKYFSQCDFESLNWICMRWLELLPIEVAQKQLLLSQKSADKVAEFIDKLLRYPLQNEE